MGKHVELHPLATLFGILCGAEIAGVIGVYLSVPIMATLRILWRHWRAYLEGANILTPAEAEVPSGEPVA
jgi:predicted PurR-regulated permease PerM